MSDFAQTKICLLPDRAVLSVAGPDSARFLHGLVTNQVEKLAGGEAVFAGLLSPQGKILFEFFLIAEAGRFLLDCPAASAADLLKRLAMYKLKAAVELADESQKFAVGAAFGGPPSPGLSIVYPDPRLAALGSRFLTARKEAGSLSQADPASYTALRVEHGVPEGGVDYAFGDAFPHEACFDLLHGVDFKKGCFVGQEVVSRMHHRGTARTRVVCVVAKAPLPEGGADITADGFAIGRLGSVAANRGIGLVRLDRAHDALEKGQSLKAGDVEINLSAPAWATYGLAAPKASA